MISSLTVLLVGLNVISYDFEHTHFAERRNGAGGAATVFLAVLWLAGCLNASRRRTTPHLLSRRGLHDCVMEVLPSGGAEADPGRGGLQCCPTRAGQRFARFGERTNRSTSLFCQIDFCFGSAFNFAASRASLMCT